MHRLAISTWRLRICWRHAATAATRKNQGGGGNWTIKERKGLLVRRDCFIVCGLFFSLFAQSLRVRRLSGWDPACFRVSRLFAGGERAVTRASTEWRAKRRRPRSDKCPSGPALCSGLCFCLRGAARSPRRALSRWCGLSASPSWASHEFRWKSVLLRARLAILTWPVFSWGLKLTIPVWPA